MNFGPSFILKPPLLHGAMAMSEVQPMSPLSRRIHERNIKTIQTLKKIPLNNTSGTNGSGFALQLPQPMVILSRDSCLDTKAAEIEES